MRAAVAANIVAVSALSTADTSAHTRVHTSVPVAIGTPRRPPFGAKSTGLGTCPDVRRVDRADTLADADDSYATSGRLYVFVPKRSHSEVTKRSLLRSW